MEALTTSLEMARATGGLVDPTLGLLMARAGYAVTFADMAPDGPELELEQRVASPWDIIDCDIAAGTVRIPEQTALDLGAVGKAWAADRAAAAAAEWTGTGVLVGCGGDVATAGPEPARGWCVRVAEHPDAAAFQDVLLHDGGLATSGTGA